MGRKTKNTTTRFTYSESYDDGEIIQTRSAAATRSYSSQNSITDIPFEEYVVTSTVVSKASSVDEAEYFSNSYSVSPKQEIMFEIPNPQTDTDRLNLLDNLYNNNTQAPPAQYPEPTQAPSGNSSYPVQAAPATSPATPSAGPISAPASLETIAFEESLGLQSGPPKVEKDDDFINDMKNILNGNAAFNPKTKSVEPKGYAQQESVAASQLPQSGHAIFDQIAKSMEYAKAYDLGSINMEQRFSDFDKLDTIKSVPASQPMPVRNAPTVNIPVAQAQSVGVGNEEFIRDLDSIIKKSKPNAAPSGQMSTDGYAVMQTAPVIAGIAVADAIQIGLGAAAVVQAQVSATQGSFSLTYDRAQRLLTNEARQAMPGSRSASNRYSRRLLFISQSSLMASANASIIIEWEGNAYGEIGTAVIRRDLSNSTEFSRSAANVTVSKIDRIPPPGVDPRAWPLIYTYEGTFDPNGNGYYEFTGEFEINAFGGIKFNRHQVVSRSLTDVISSPPESFVQKGTDNLVAVPTIPEEQVAYLRTHLP